jgi:hypothetical protein
LLVVQFDSLVVNPPVIPLIEGIVGKVEVELVGGTNAEMLLLVEFGRECPNGVGILNATPLDCEG